MRVFSNSAVSLDGKIGTWRHDHVAIGSEADRRWMGVLRAQADAVLVGGATYRAWSIPMVEPDFARSRPLINAVLTRTGAGPRSGRFFQDPRTVPVFLGGPEANLEGFPPGTVVHRAQSSASVAWALEVLRDVHGVDNLLIEGGGDIIFQLLEADLLDEVYVTLCPCIIGGRDAPTLADGSGFEADGLRRLTLEDMRREGDEVYLKYRVVRQRR